MSEHKVTRVRDVMKSGFDMIDGKLTVADALKTMQHVDTKCLIVDKRHDDDEYGMVLLSDIAKRVLACDRSPERVNIYEIMSKPVISVRSDMDIRYCARMFEQFGLSRAPVIDDRKVVGVVSFTDMVLKGFGF
ncbi:CBS domain protein [Thiogranum longum]|uniref:CBS domain protein n=1 Tax=Thiogranum longum TaxID=1537524 RepID=A0A4R1HHY5_9GAMM|nr:CBS domain-containing protein [Thiogranum longum]TCK19029.1 CBS domain protein [Thiogranum longum]